MSADVFIWIDGRAVACGCGAGDRFSDLFEFVLRPTRLEGCSVSDAPEEGSRFIDERTVFGRRSPMALLGRVERRLDEIGLVPDKSFGAVRTRKGRRIDRPRRSRRRRRVHRSK
jgi:hypothetical protein